MSEALQPTGPQSPAEWDSFIGGHVSAMVAALPLTIPDAALRRARSHLKIAFLKAPQTSKVFECHPLSVSRCIAMSALTGLYPGGHNPDVDLIPRWDKHLKAYSLNWQISYRGYIRLCRRNPGWDLFPFVVFDGDAFDHGIDSDRGPWFNLNPGARPKLGDPDVAWGSIRYVVPLVHSPMGLRFQVLDKGQVEARRRCAQDDSFWKRWPIEKTLGAACRYAGQREMYPTDDPTRYGMSLDIDQETQGRAEESETPPALTGADFVALPPAPPDHEPQDPLLPEEEQKRHEQAIKKAGNLDACAAKLGPPPWRADDVEHLKRFARAGK